jgi:hypothetical protein
MDKNSGTTLVFQGDISMFKDSIDTGNKVDKET